MARGRAWRDAAPTEGHAKYAINRRRKDPVGILRAQDDARVQELVPIRYGRMSASAFVFYRGSPHHIPPPPLHRTRALRCCRKLATPARRSDGDCGSSCRTSCASTIQAGWL